MESNLTNEELQRRLEALSERVAVLESSLAELVRRLDYSSATTAELPPFHAPGTNGSAPEHSEVFPTAPAVAAAPLKISAGLASVIKLIAVGQGEEAHRLMRELPSDELREQPAVVALVAAALFVQRGDFSSGLTALSKARSLTDDPRLLRVMQSIEAQIQ